MASLAEIYDWFMTGKKPTQAQFWASWGSFWNKLEQIPQSAISNLTATLNAKAEKAQFDAHKTDADAHKALFDLKQSLTDKGAQGGYAPLNEFTKLAAEYLNIVNDFVTGGSEALASAETVKVLKGQIDAINMLLTSDNVNLDNVQEIVDAIETVQTSLSTILVNDLTTGGTTKALTAEMGKSLKAFIDGLTNSKFDIANISQDIETEKLSTTKVASVKQLYDWSTSLFQTWVLGINRILGITYSIGLNDYKTKNIFSHNSPITFTVPTNAITAIPVGAKFSYTVQGLGTVTISGAGITFIQKNLVYTTGDTFYLEKVNTDTWAVDGNIPLAGAISPYTAFINTVLGNNSTAVLGDSSKPFLTDVAAFASLPANDGNAWDFVYLCNNVSRTIIFPTQRKIRFICKNSGTFNLNNWFGFGVSIPEIYFDAPGCNITGSVTVQTSLLPALPVYIDVNDFTFTNTNVGGGNTFMDSNAKSFISINNIVCSIAGGGSLFNFGTFFINKATTNRHICSAAAEATIPELVIAGTGANFWGNSYPINKFKTKKITGTSNGVFEISGIFDVTDLETSATIDIVSYGILTGVRSANYLGLLRLGFQASNVMVMNFYGKLASWTIDTSAANNLTIHDSTIFLDQFLYRTTGFSGTRTWNFRNVEIIATNVSSTLSQNPNTNALTVINKTGFIKTNGTFDAQTTFVNRTSNSY